MNDFVFGSLAALTLVACQPPADASSPLPSAASTGARAAAPPPAASALTSASAPATAAPTSPSAEPTAAPEATRDAAPGSPEAIAQMLLKEGGITYSASKRSFLFTISWNEEGNGAGLRVEVLGEDGKRESIEICWPVECEQKVDERLETFGPSIAARLRDGGYAPVTPVDWPSDKSEMEVPALSAKLRFRKDHIEIVRVKRATALAKLKFSAPHKPYPSYVAVAPDKSLFAVGYAFDPGSKYGEGFNLYTEVHVYRAP